MYSWLKSLFIPKSETPMQIVAREMNETHIDLLKAQKELEYWSSMVPMLNQRAARLKFQMREAVES